MAYPAPHTGQGKVLHRCCGSGNEIIGVGCRNEVAETFSKWTVPWGKGCCSCWFWWILSTLLMLVSSCWLSESPAPPQIGQGYVLQRCFGSGNEITGVGCTGTAQVWKSAWSPSGGANATFWGFSGMTFWNESLIFKCPALSILDRLCNDLQQVRIGWFGAGAGRCVIIGNKEWGEEEVVRTWRDLSIWVNVMRGTSGRNERMRSWGGDIYWFESHEAGLPHRQLIQLLFGCRWQIGYAPPTIINSITILIAFRSFIMH